MTDAEQREAARQFIKRWMGKGKEDEDGRSYWIDLLTNVLGMDNVTERLNFEKKVIIDGNTKRIDIYIPETRVIIEQKSLGKGLDQKIRNSGEIDLTPFEQADRYNSKLTFDERARWIVTCNFAEIWIYDMNEKQPEPTKIALDELQTKYVLLNFLVKKDVKKLSHEMEISIQAGDIVGLIYDAFLAQYRIPDIKEKDETPEQKEKREHKLRSLNALCVRLVFCLYAEDAGIFGKRDMFHDYLENYEVKDCRRALIELFKILDTPASKRDEYLEEDLAQFPYVNGGLFADEDIEIPPFTDEIKELLLTKASEDFDWRDISPTIFGAVFESTLNPETRRSGGMHYTSIENIHKVIDPLFMDDLNREFEEIKEIKVKKTRDAKLEAFQDKLASLTFLDPACGSGNFLTETYLSLRRLENEVIREKMSGQMTLAQVHNPIKVSIQQFYGIEINDFAVTVGKTALWIAESQMLEETKSIVFGFNDDFLPLKTYVNITEANALRIDWNDVVPAERLNYIMGNPPFSILSKICAFYLDRGIRFFLFTPSLTAFAGRNVCMRMTHIVPDSDITYENGAVVRTAFVTNLNGDVVARTAPDLKDAIAAAMKKVLSESKRSLPKYSYPDYVLTAAMLQRYSHYGIDFAVHKGDCINISKLDAQREKKKTIFGGGLLLSERAAAKKSAAERAAAERAAATVWQLSEREKQIVAGLGLAGGVGEN